MVFRQGDPAYQTFAAQYDKAMGVFFCREREAYILYCGGYRYKCNLYHNRTKEDIAFLVKGFDPISQKHTLQIATASVAVTNLDPKYFLYPEGGQETAAIYREVWRQHPGRSFGSMLKKLNDALDLAAPGQQENDAAPEDLRRYAEEWKKLKDMTKAKREFSKNFLAKWDYTGFEPVSREGEGSLFRFRLEPLDDIITKNEAFFKEHAVPDPEDDEEPDPADIRSMDALRADYAARFKLRSLVEILLPGDDPENGVFRRIFGTIQDFAVLEDHCLLDLDFKDKSQYSDKDIPAAGTMQERIAPDYKNYETALDAMVNLSELRQWSAAERVIIDKKCEGFACRQVPTFNSSTLTVNQKQAVCMALNTPDFLLVQGPPGTGKTTIITEMVRNFVERNQRVLVCSKNNMAVDNILEKWIKENKLRPDGHLCVRLGNEDGFRLDFLKGYTPSQVTLRVQERIYNKSKEEKQNLIREVENQLQTLKDREQQLDGIQQVCFTLTQILLILPRICEIYSQVLKVPGDLKNLGLSVNVGNLLAAQQATEFAYALGKNGILLPLGKLLCRQEPPAAAQCETIAKNYEKLLQQLGLYRDLQCGFLTKLILFFHQEELQTQQRLLDKHIQQLEALAPTVQQLPGFPGNPLRDLKKAFDPYAILETLLVPDGDDAQIARSLKSCRENILSGYRSLRNRVSRIRGVLDDWLGALSNSKSSSLEQLMVLDGIRVIGSTCMGIMSDDDFKDTAFDVVIVDEAGQIPIFDIMVPIIKAKKVILIGDHMQLPPMDEQEFARHYANLRLGEDHTTDAHKQLRQEVEATYNVSLFEKLYRAPGLDAAKIMIQKQFRMHPDIAEFISQNFYGGKYESGVTAEDRSISIVGLHDPIYFYDTCNVPAQIRQETLHDPGCSNDLEAGLCSDILVQMLLAIRAGNYRLHGNKSLELKDRDGTVTGYDIGVITGYKKQVEAIRENAVRKLSAHMPAEEAEACINKVQIDSVDSFQGRDNEIILFSMTRSNDIGKIGFLRDVRRLNVAMTRAKSMLVMIGDSATLTAYKKGCAHNKQLPAADVYKALVAYCKEKEYYHDVQEEMKHGL